MPQSIETALEHALIVFDACLMRVNRHFWITLARAFEWANDRCRALAAEDKKMNSVELDVIGDYIEVDFDSDLP